MTGACALIDKRGLATGTVTRQPHSTIRLFSANYRFEPVPTQRDNVIPEPSMILLLASAWAG